MDSGCKVEKKIAVISIFQKNKDIFPVYLFSSSFLVYNSFPYFCIVEERGRISPLSFFVLVMTPVDKRIEELTEEFFKGSDLFLVDVKVNKGNQVQVFADSDSGMTIEKCTMLNRYLEKQLNTEMPFSENYSLEVSSPGLSQPFKAFRQYLKNKNRDVEVEMNDGQKAEGRMIDVDENRIQLEIVRKEKNKIMESKIIEIKFSDIRNTHKVIHF